MNISRRIASYLVLINVSVNRQIGGRKLIREFFVVLTIFVFMSAVEALLCDVFGVQNCAATVSLGGLNLCAGDRPFIWCLYSVRVSVMAFRDEVMSCAFLVRVKGYPRVDNTFDASKGTCLVFRNGYVTRGVILPIIYGTFLMVCGFTNARGVLEDRLISTPSVFRTYGILFGYSMFI